MIAWWTALILGGLGAVVADGSRIANVMLVSKRWPWNAPKQRLPFAMAIVVRIGCAAALSSVVAMQSIEGWSNQPLVLFVLGLSAPSVVQHGTRLGRALVRAVIREYGGGSNAIE